MSVYDELEFAPVLITNVFKPHKGKRLIAAHRKEGRTPFVGGSGSFNSITGFSDVEPLFPSGWLTLTYNGSVGHAKLQPAPFFASDDVIALEPLNHNATDQALLVLASIITRECVAKYSYGVKLNLARLMKQTIMVPITTNADEEQTVDWDGMTRLGQELFVQARANVRSAQQTHAGDDDSLPDLKFEPMLIPDVFDTMTASKAWYDKSKLNTTGEAVYPFVSRTKASNGVDGLCPVQEKRPEPGNAITIGLDTQTIGYQPVSFYTSQNIQVLRHMELNEDNALVLAALIRKQMGKFSWGGNGATLGRLMKTHIMVPVSADTDGETVVDWPGMTQYGRALRVRAEHRLGPVLEVA